MSAFRIARETTAFALDPSGKQTKRQEDERHLKWIRTLPSVISGGEPCEACHIRYGSGIHNKKRTGKGQKPSDCWTVPMTPDEHREQHAFGDERGWWDTKNIDPLYIANRLYEVSGDTKRAIEIISTATGRYEKAET